MSLCELTLAGCAANVERGVCLTVAENTLGMGGAIVEMRRNLHMGASACVAVEVGRHEREKIESHLSHRETRHSNVIIMHAFSGSYNYNQCASPG